MDAPAQLALPFPAAPAYEPADFLAAGSNAEALAWLARPADWPGGRLVLWGEAGCGKTHLLHIWSGRTGAALRGAAALRGLPPRPEPGGVAIDDADAPGEEAALLHLLNAAQERGLPVLMAARTPPACWHVALPDLASRLRAAAAVRVLPPEDGLLRAILARLLADRQLAVPAETQDWLLARLPRTPAALADAVRRLDEAALASGRKIGRPLAARVLGEEGGIGIGSPTE